MSKIPVPAGTSLTLVNNTLPVLLLYPDAIYALIPSTPVKSRSSSLQYVAIPNDEMVISFDSVSM